MMGGMREQIQVSTNQSIEMRDITRQVNQIVQESGVEQGFCIVFCPHTTAALTINENADPDVQSDLQAAFRKVVPQVNFEHAEGNSPAHFLSSLTGASLYLPVEGAQLRLGRWQGVYFCEFDGPRQRQVWVQVFSE